MGKKRIAAKQGVEEGQRERKTSARGGASKTGVAVGILQIQSTYNNTKMLLTDLKGNAVVSSSAGALGFSGARKGTPYAAAKVAEAMGEKAKAVGLTSVHIKINGVGAGRESAIRSFVSKGITVESIQDITPIPFNGPRPPRPRRV